MITDTLLTRLGTVSRYSYDHRLDVLKPEGISHRNINDFMAESSAFPSGSGRSCIVSASIGHPLLLRLESESIPSFPCQYDEYCKGMTSSVLKLIAPGGPCPATVLQRHDGFLPLVLMTSHFNCLYWCSFLYTTLFYGKGDLAFGNANPVSCLNPTSFPYHFRNLECKWNGLLYLRAGGKVYMSISFP